MSAMWRKIANVLMVLMLAIGAMAVLPGCKEKGPAERAGEKADQAAEKAGEAVEEAGEAAQDAAK